MEKLQILIYLAVGVFAIVYSIYKNQGKQKSQQKNQSQNTYKKPVNHQVNKNKGNQPKSIEDIINTLLNDSKDTVGKEVKREPVVEQTYTDESSLELQSQEAQYYAQDTELKFNNETVDYDIENDHRMLENTEIGSVQVEKESDWVKTDWGKAVILAEVLQRPKY